MGSGLLLFNDPKGLEDNGLGDESQDEEKCHQGSDKDNPGAGPYLHG
jgi:hypothetical protein